MNAVAICTVFTVTAVFTIDSVYSVFTVTTVFTINSVFAFFTGVTFITFGTDNIAEINRTAVSVFYYKFAEFVY